MQEIEHKKGKIYYSMGEVAEMFDVNQSLLRYWEQEFDILKPHRNKKGNRMFTPQDVDNIRIIYHLLKERKMKIEVARKYIKDYRKDIDRDAEITERLMNIRAMLLQIKQDLAYDGKVVDDELEYEDVSDETAYEESSAPLAEEADVVAVHEAVGTDKESDVQNVASVAGEPVVAKPPFEEQMLFEVAVPLELVQGNAVAVDDGFASAKAAFENKTAEVAGSDSEESTPKVQAIEQTLF